MTEATQQALCGLRDLSTIKWYVIPLLAIVFYIYTKEIKEKLNSFYSAKATYASPERRPNFPPPQATTKNCFPLTE